MSRWRAAGPAPLHLGAGGIATGVDDAPPGMAALPGQRPPAGSGFVEPCPVGHQFGDGTVAVGHDRADGVGIAESPARGDRVGDVGVDGIVSVREDDRDATLGVERGGLADLAQQDDPPAPPVRRQCGGQAGNTGADDDDVGALSPQSGAAARWRHSPPPGCPISIIRWTLARASAAVFGST
jgi:hypothetical protein